VCVWVRGCAVVCLCACGFQYGTIDFVRPPGPCVSVCVCVHVHSARCVQPQHTLRHPATHPATHVVRVPDPLVSLSARVHMCAFVSVCYAGVIKIQRETESLGRTARMSKESTVQSIKPL